MAQSKRVPEEEPITRIAFTVEEPGTHFVTASAVDNGHATLKNIIPRGNSRYSEFFTLTGTDPDTVAALAETDTSTDISLHSRSERSGLFEFVVGTECPIIALCHMGAIPYRVEADAGEGSIEVVIPRRKDAATLAEAFLATHPAVSLTSKHQHESNTLLRSDVEIEQTTAALLTDRQWEILSTAHEWGYYNWPRDTNGETIAQELDISGATFHQHLRAAEQKFMNLIFERE